MSAHSYSDTAVETALSSGVSAAATEIQVGSVSGFPIVYPYFLDIDFGSVTLEVVEVTSGAGTTLQVTRGASTTSAVGHSSGAIVRHVAPASHYEDVEAHVDATAAVHGLAGTVVGTTDTQTLTNKTIDSASNDLTIAEADVTGLTSQLASFTAADLALDGRLDLVEKGATLHVFDASGALQASDVVGAKKAIIETWGGGGGGGGCAANAAGNSSCGGAGGGGGYARAVVDVTLLPWTVTVGAGGAGGTAGANAGTAGGTTAVNNSAATPLCGATGGGAGVAGVTGATVGASTAQGTGGAGTVGTELISANLTDQGLRFAAGNTKAAPGGDSPKGGTGGLGPSTTVVGQAGSSPGGGGSGGNSLASGAAQGGGAGAAGRVVITAIY